MALTRSSRNAYGGNAPEEEYRATEYEWDEEPSKDHPAKRLEARRATVSPIPKRSRVYVEIDSDDTGDEDVQDCRSTRAKRLKLDTSIKEVEDTGAAKIFKSIPIEIHQQIALYLPEDKDILNYSLICKKSNSAITYSVWRERFSKFFDDVDGQSPKDASLKYAFRKYIGAKWTCFDLDKYGGRVSKDVRDTQARNQLDLLNVFRGLLLESNALEVPRYLYGRAEIKGLNLMYIREMLRTSEVDIIDSVFNTSFDKNGNDSSSIDKVVTANDKNTLIYVIQLILTPFSLDPNLCNGKVGHFDISQYQAYATAKVQPAFTGLFKQSVNIRWLLHIVNFFKFHLKSGGEGLLAHEYDRLEPDQFPQFWKGHIKGGTQPLARHWKGVHTFMEEDTLESLREWDGHGCPVHTDSLDGNESFEDMDFFFDRGHRSSYEWPKNFEALLCSNPFEDPAQQRRAKRARTAMDHPPAVKQFWGSCRGSGKGHVFGRVHALTTQQGFHGFQRLTLMKYYTEQDANGHDVYDPCRAWCYEGCVLPGGRIIVGRWWSAMSDPNSDAISSGPFLWWNTHRGGEEEIKEDEALNFMETFADLM
ncbi:uncharacterized protein RSE6_08870 [Rhynchosporium secalis]|uniref:F-box domain-containing protein n=1 Tax=Rhynchosporium secalis TaxID=38038 RepID=A0A1E1MGJ9_RHYSE|nr:uncharacterized protein RSE6_08870 [Rhynchosporium secalis]